MEKGIVIKNITIITVILIIVFLSQQAQVKIIANNFYQKNVQSNGYVAKTTDWVKTSAWPIISREVSKIRAFTAQEYIKQKNYFLQNVWNRLKTFSGR